MINIIKTAIVDLFFFKFLNRTKLEGTAFALQLSRVLSGSLKNTLTEFRERRALSPPLTFTI